MSELLRLASAGNFRDVISPGLTGADGVALARGVFYRSGELRLSDVDAATVGALGITEVFDLRADYEVEAHPDVAIGAAQWVHCPVPQFSAEEAIAMPNADAMREGIQQLYRGFITDPRAHRSLGTVLRALAAGTGPQVFHCSAGKDRTGWVSLILHHLAGVPDDAAEAEYLASNELSAATREKYLGMLAEALGEDRVATYEPMMRVDLSYLAAARDELARNYGTLEAYLTEALGVDEAAQRALRSRLWEDAD